MHGGQMGRKGSMGGMNHGMHGKGQMGMHGQGMAQMTQGNMMMQQQLRQIAFH